MTNLFEKLEDNSEKLEDNSENGNLRHCESFNFVHPMSLNAFGSNFAQA